MGAEAQQRGGGGGGGYQVGGATSTLLPVSFWYMYVCIGQLLEYITLVCDVSGVFFCAAAVVLAVELPAVQAFSRKIKF